MKLKIRGSETPDNPSGRMATRAQAVREARSRLTPALKRAGFTGYAVETPRGWNLCIGAVVGVRK